MKVIIRKSSFFVWLFARIGKEERYYIEINDWEEGWWIGGLAPSQEYKCPPDGIFCLQYLGLHFVKWTPHANPRLGEAMQIYLVHWRWKMVSGRGRNLPARKIKRATKTKGWTPQIRGGEFGRRCLFLSDRNSASFPGYCKTWGESESRFCWNILYSALDLKFLLPIRNSHIRYSFADQ